MEETVVWCADGDYPVDSRISCVCDCVRIRKQSVPNLVWTFVEHPKKDILFCFLISEGRSGVAR